MPLLTAKAPPQLLPQGSEGFAAPPTPKLICSRENTPCFDDPHQHSPVTSKHNSDTCNSAEEAATPQNSALGPENAHKRPLGQPKDVNPKRKSRGLDKQWVPLDRAAFASFCALGTVASAQVVERLQGSTKAQAEIAEARRILENHWTSETLPKAFVARLRVTRLPSLRYLQARARDSLDESFQPLDVDMVQRRRATLEELLQAETRELEKLEEYHNSLNALYERDRQELVEYRQSTAELGKMLDAEMQQSRQKYRLVECRTDENTPAEQPTMAHSPAFDPNSDADTRAVLSQLHGRLRSLVPHIPRLEKFAACFSALSSACSVSARSSGDPLSWRISRTQSLHEAAHPESGWKANRRFRRPTPRPKKSGH